jgi:predicted house-cleaning noncanonical NTP pyrophosphatase (MazG superfamily)
MTKFTAKDFVDYVNDEFDSETLQLLKNVLDERLTLLRKMGDMANPRTVVQGYKLNKQDLKEMRGFTMSELRMKAIDILKMIGVSLSEKNIEDMVNGIIAKIDQHKAGAVVAEGDIDKTRLESIVTEEVQNFLNPSKTEEKLYEFVENAVGSEVSAIVYEIANNYGYTGSSGKQFKTVTTQIRHILPQILQENRKAFMREIESTKRLMGVDEIIL